MSIFRTFAVLLALILAVPLAAQEGPLSVATVEREPFAQMSSDGATGFSIELMRAIGQELERDVTFTFYDSFPDMLASVESGIHDAAIANISITAAREQVLDFSQPIFESGIGVLLAQDAGGNPILSALLTRDFLAAILLALAALFGSGMLMWVFERKTQPYFQREGRDALFPSFWWALNVVVNGGFEERMPLTRMGRVFAVTLVISSLFVVSIFVATITSAVTVSALQNSVDSINDLDGQRVATIGGSTSAEFLDLRDLRYTSFDAPDAMFTELEAGRLDAIVFDAPILSFYANAQGAESTRMLPRIYRRENYGIALPQDSLLKERIDQTLLRLREEGTYDGLITRWFGNSVD